MLPYALAIAVGLSSSILFLTAFFFKDIHRPDDFFWSTIGLFYALVLWFCATGIRGAVLLGQLAVVALLTAYIWQTIKLRDAIANPEKQAELDNFSVVEFLKNRLMQSPVLVKPETPESQSETSTVAQDTVNKDNISKTSVSQAVPEVKIEPTTTTPIETSDTLNQEESTPETVSAIAKTKSEEVVTEIVETKSENIGESTAEKITQTQPESDESLATKSDNLSITKTPTETVTAQPTAVEITEIAVEQVTIVEEETNWDDEVEDIPATSVTVVEEVTEESPTTTLDATNSESSTTEDKNKDSDSESN